MGVQVYVLSASIARDVAGPGIVVSFLLSGLAAFLAALCYAEMAVRYPRAGSAYSYTYVAAGEVWAFLVGWSVTLENMIGLAAVSRAASAYVDSLTYGWVSRTTKSILRVEDIDILAFGIILFVAIALSFGARFTSYMNNVFTSINIVAIVAIVVMGAIHADPHNWTSASPGGFLPYGWKGVLAGSASCFYAYIGFDAIATAGEEARDPQRSIPLATFFSMTVATAAYVGVSSVLTLMSPYDQIHHDSGLPDVFEAHGVHWVKVVVIVGALCGMTTSLICTTFALTRIVYSMAEDGLLYAFFGRVNSVTQVPMLAMFIFSLMAAILALVVKLTALVEVMSIGTLFAYFVVCACVIILRYQPSPHQTAVLPEDSGGVSPSHSFSSAADVPTVFSVGSAGRLKPRFFQLGILPFFSGRPGRLVTVCMVAICALSLLICITITGATTGGRLQLSEAGFAILLVVLTLPWLAAIALILLHQQNDEEIAYKVPFVPFLPIISVFFLSLLMANLNLVTWIRLGVWMFVGGEKSLISGLSSRCSRTERLCPGMLIYLTYGIKHSKLNEPTPENLHLTDATVKCPPTEEVMSVEGQAPTG
ncbi:hypothetical protein LAZ67_6000357 [Cordylochernes scorpioides]|uniref:Cationic amino acid transporter C-terminal domain-containing protein n=1 Tax=Cordylochernes scorpioides TaxID=51811 RepID=A0ABY6KKD5_9ARAC|nr:hypothetical protein LAZ67_6000357 [Cordylochernes scorpioides]